MRKILYELVKVAFCIAITAMIQFYSEGIFGDELRQWSVRYDGVTQNAVFKEVRR